MRRLSGGCAGPGACETRHKEAGGAWLACALLATTVVYGSHRSPVSSRQSTVVSHLSQSPVISHRSQSPVTSHRSQSPVWVATAGFGLTGADQPGEAGQAAPGAAHEAAGAGEEEHGGRGIIDVVARIFNFALLVGTLAYFLRAPIRTYLANRGEQIRSDLVNAAQLKESAAAQIAAIDRRMQALPAEIDALRAQGAQDIAAEEARIQAAAAAERERLLEHARREIDLQVKIAERDLVAHAADLAVGVASERIKRTITDEDQKRLVDRYVRQLKPEGDRR